MLDCANNHLLHYNWSKLRKYMHNDKHMVYKGEYTNKQIRKENISVYFRYD